MKIGCFQWRFSYILALWQEHIFKFSQRTINKFLIWVILGPIPIRNEWVIVTTQLQLQFNLSWCDLNLSLPNNFTPAQPPFTTQTLDICGIGWSKVKLVIIHFSGGGGVRRYILEFSRTGLIVYIVKTRAGGPTARLLAGCRAAGPM